MSLIEKALKKLQESGQAPVGPVFRTPPAVPAAEPLPVPAPEAAADPKFARVVRRVPAPRTGGAPALHLNLSALRGAGLLAPEHGARQLSQMFRRIKRPLIANAIGHGVPGGQFIMIASALPGDGKTFTSLNLALSLATERDLNVLLVDADVAKAHLSRVFGLERTPGLLELLRDGDTPADSLVRSTNIPGLAVLGAGSGSADATELLGSARMADVCAALASPDSSRIILFDSPPLLLSTESHALAQHMGQVVVVVRAGVTLRSDLDAALEHVRERPYVGLVLNQSPSVVSSSYGYHYGDSDSSAPT